MPERATCLESDCSGRQDRRRLSSLSTPTPNFILSSPRRNRPCTTTPALFPAESLHWIELIASVHFLRRFNSASLISTSRERNPLGTDTLPSDTMSKPHLWTNPLRYLRWASHEKPAIFYSLIIGTSGPVLLTVLPPIRRFFGDVDPQPIPLTYPSKYFTSSLIFAIDVDWSCGVSSTVQINHGLKSGLT